MAKSSKELLLKSKKQVYSERLGNHASLFQGEGFEFSELREYIYGDDIRKIDWKTTAKLGKPYVKIYHEERELNVVVFSLLGGSIYFGSVRQKSEVMAQIVSLLGLSAIKFGDRFSHFLVADRLYEYVKPTKKEYGVYSAIEAISSFEMIGKEGSFDVLKTTIRKYIKSKSLIFILSDFIGDVDLGALSKKHDIVSIIVRDKFEEEPIELGAIGLVDLEDLKPYSGNMTYATIKAYKDAIVHNDKKLLDGFKKQGIRWLKIYTDDDIYLKLARGL
ncbi:MAG: DUF58 domain-containing protein [Campylobacterales bacterium]|nr:DUF58 domain-containing protein [Campylobacterales bacterium]